MSGGFSAPCPDMLTQITRRHGIGHKIAVIKLIGRSLKPGALLGALHRDIGGKQGLERQIVLLKQIFHLGNRHLAVMPGKIIARMIEMLVFLVGLGLHLEDWKHNVRGQKTV